MTTNQTPFWKCKTTEGVLFYTRADTMEDASAAARAHFGDNVEFTTEEADSWEYALADMLEDPKP